MPAAGLLRARRIRRLWRIASSRRTRPSLRSDAPNSRPRRPSRKMVASERRPQPDDYSLTDLNQHRLDEIGGERPLHLRRPKQPRGAVRTRHDRVIAYARMKTDKIDAAILARLHAGGFLPEVWSPGEDTHRLRRHTAERVGVREQVVRTKGRIHAILHANLIRSTRDISSKEMPGRPAVACDEKAIVGRLVDEPERHSRRCGRTQHGRRFDVVMAWGAEAHAVDDRKRRPFAGTRGRRSKAS